MKTAYIHSPACLGHETNFDHPECKERLEAIQTSLDAAMPSGVTPVLANATDRAHLLLAHAPAYVDHVFKTIPEWGMAMFDKDTVVSPQSGEAALHAVGAVIDAVDLVMTRKAVNAFCAVRPPGHHAHRGHAAGFCLFNNAAIGALYALDTHQLDRVAILDFDVHHGDGTQDIVQNNPKIFFASTYESYPQYAATPDTHRATGVADNVMNRGFPVGTTGQDIVQTWKTDILPRVKEFNPQLVIVSAGFDGHKDDAISGHRFETGDYEELMRLYVELASQCCDNRLVTVLEGGYNLNALAQSVTRCLHVLGR